MRALFTTLIFVFSLNAQAGFEYAHGSICGSIPFDQFTHCLEQFDDACPASLECAEFAYGPITGLCGLPKDMPERLCKSVCQERAEHECQSSDKL